MTIQELKDMFKFGNKFPRFSLPAGYGRITKHMASKKGHTHVKRESKGEGASIIYYKQGRFTKLSKLDE
jgi:hypothetical protein